MNQHLDTAVCLRCLRPVEGTRHYCAECGAATGAHTLYLPFEGVPAEADFLARWWKRCGDKKLGWGKRALLFLPFVLFPVVLIVWLLAWTWSRLSGQNAPT